MHKRITARSKWILDMRSSPHRMTTARPEANNKTLLDLEQGFPVFPERLITN